jgi:hypothetical protein
MFLHFLQVSKSGALGHARDATAVVLAIARRDVAANRKLSRKKAESIATVRESAATGTERGTETAEIEIGRKEKSAEGADLETKTESVANVVDLGTTVNEKSVNQTLGTGKSRSKRSQSTVSGTNISCTATLQLKILILAQKLLFKLEFSLD